MKTVEEKALDLVNHHPLINVSSTAAREDIARAVTLLLKEQDRDTRHACAEAVNSLHSTVSQHATFADCEAHNNAITVAYAACINAKAA